MENFRIEGHSGINEKVKMRLSLKVRHWKTHLWGGTDWNGQMMAKISAFIITICPGLQLKFRDNENPFKAHLFQ